MSVYSVIVTFNPVIANVESLLRQLTEQVNGVVVVDNGSVNEVDLAACVAKFERVELMKLACNHGIAAAQNFGIRSAAASGAEYIVFFDQDSSIESGFVDELTLAFQATPPAKKVACVAPVFVDSRYGFYYPLIEVNKYGFRRKIEPSNKKELFNVSLVISSGSCISVDALKDIGGMNEDFFIDYVDTEWCLRAISNGYSIVIAPKAKMEHAIGDSSIKILFWRVPVHSAFRRYYRVRNSFYLLKLPHVPKVLALQEIFSSFVYQAILIFSTRSFSLYFRSWIVGVLDGILNRPKLTWKL
ncbi:glycosyltransferase family 2 protein [Chitinibacter sp. SCUT-21]|uniref:glycosyltransferase family 2 protein n=1 Tax=Chitinibacter sp. SCUT-21 TaxID=2970891 RepID=UPI0035A5CAF3